MPYASIYAKAGDGPRSLLVLGRYDHDDLHWISADRAVLVTRHGRLVKTAGFPVDLRETLRTEDDPIISNSTSAISAMIYKRYVDITPGNHFGVEVNSRFAEVGEERIEILGLHFDTVVIREIAEAPQLEWEFENTFWIDRESGFVWRSIQHFAPGMPPIEISVLKPAA